MTDELEAALGAGDEVAAGLFELVQATEIQVAAVHHIVGAGFDDQQVQDLDIVQLAVGDLDKGRDGAAQVQEGVQFDGTFGTAEASPREEAQAEIDGGRVQGIDRLFQVQAEVLVAVQPTRLADQYLGQIGVDPPVPHFVGVGQSAASHPISEAQMVQLIRSGVQAVRDVAQSFPESQLGEPHGQELLPDTRGTGSSIPVVANHATLELLRMHLLHYLRKGRCTRVHGAPYQPDSEAPRPWTEKTL